MFALCKCLSCGSDRELSVVKFNPVPAQYGLQQLSTPGGSNVTTASFKVVENVAIITEN